MLEDPRLRVGAIEQRHLGEPHALPVQRLHLVNNETRLFLVVGGGVDAQLLALALGSPEVLAQPRLVPRDDRVGGVEDVSLRAVILLELHHLRDAEVAHELVHVADFGPAKPVYRLVVVSDREHAPTRPREQLDPLVLQLVGVLELVDEDVAEARLVVMQEVQVRGEQLVGSQQQLGEVDHAFAIALRVVIGVEGDHAARELVARFDRVGAQARLLGVVDEALQLARRVFLLVQALRLGEPLDERELVGGIEDLEELRQARVAVMRAQQPVAQPVEGAHPHAARVDGQHRREPREHLARRLVGEGDREDARRAHFTRLDQVGDTRGEHACLAAARAREDQGALARQGNRLELLGIEAGGEAGHDGCGVRGAIISCRRGSRTAKSLKCGMPAIRSDRP